MSQFDVYCHTSPSGKRYVGLSKHGLAERWRQHVESAAYGSDYLIHRAIRKYGAGSFRASLLSVCDTAEGASSAERYWIKALGTAAPSGYNATLGGEGTTDSPALHEKRCAAWTPERRAAASALTADRNRGNRYGESNRGSKRSSESRLKMSEAARGHARHTSPHTAEARAHMSAAQRKRFENPAQRFGCGNGNRGKTWSVKRRAAQESRG